MPSFAVRLDTHQVVCSSLFVLDSQYRRFNLISLQHTQWFKEYQLIIDKKGVPINHKNKKIVHFPPHWV